MAIVEEQDIFKIISGGVPKWVLDARSYSKTLKALIDGKDHVEELVQIDHQESDKKILARKKYTFSTKDLASRLLSNTEAVWSAQGGSKVYGHIEDEEKRKTLIKAISNVRGGKTLEQWNEAYWMPVYHTDPSGITILEYNTAKNIDPFPVNLSINHIRNYESNGINVDWILFEPVSSKTEDNKDVLTWRFIDDAYDYSIIEVKEKEGSLYKIDINNTFENPFKSPPCLINSSLVDPENLNRLSPFDRVVELLKEYLRDKSIKTIFKFTQGFPLFWRYVTYCRECTGTGIGADGNTCRSCNGNKIVGRRDVTDSIDMPIPTEDKPVLDKIADWITPPSEILDKYTEGLTALEMMTQYTMWGAIIEHQKSNTATGRMIDVQPIIQRLNKYSQDAEVREKKLTEWYDLYLNPLQNPEDQKISISLGRNYSLLPSDTILDIYEKAKEQGDNNTIRDTLFQQYLLAKYKNDPVNHQLAVLKSEVEPYVHYSVKEVIDTYDKQEAQKKMQFQDFWNQAILVNKDSQKLREEFNTWFKNNRIKSKQIENGEH